MGLTFGIFIIAAIILTISGICLGLLVALVTGRRMNRGHIYGTVNTTGNNEQLNAAKLDKIEKAIAEGTGIAIVGLGIAVILFVGAELYISRSQLPILFAIGFMAILYAATRYGKLKTSWALLLFVLMSVVVGYLVYRSQSQPDSPQSIIESTPAQSTTAIVVNLIGGLIASIISIVVWEMYKRPKLTIELPEIRLAIQTLPDGTRRAFYKLQVRNTGKSPAYSCKIFMRFLDEQGTKPIITDVISGKWDKGPEPVIFIPVPNHLNPDGSIISTTREAQQLFLIPFAEVTDIHHNVPAEVFCPFMKYEGEPEYYAFSALGYIKGQAPGHKVPEWKIKIGKNVLEVELVFSGKRSQKQRFLLDNQSVAADGIKISKL